MMKDALKFNALMHEAVAEFYALHFDSSVSLMCRAFLGLKITKLEMSDAFYNGLFDGVEMLELMLENLPVIEQNNFAKNTIQSVKIALENLDTQELFLFQKKLENFQQLLKGIQVGFSFFKNNNLSLNSVEIGLSFAIVEDGTIELYKTKNSPEIDLLIEEFNACFNLEKATAKTSQNKVDLLVDQKEFDAAILALEEMLVAFPETQKSAFYQLGELFFEQKKFQKATDAYMKSVVMGMPKNKIMEKILIACNYLIQHSNHQEERSYWREFLEKI